MNVHDADLTTKQRFRALIAAEPDLSYTAIAQRLGKTRARISQLAKFYKLGPRKPGRKPQAMQLQEVTR